MTNIKGISTENIYLVVLYEYKQITFVIASDNDKIELLSCVTFFNCSLLLTEVCEPVNVFYENHQDMTKVVD